MKPSRIIAAVMVLVLSMNITAGAYTFSESRRDSPGDFNSFLEACSDFERVQIMQALQGLPSDYNTAKTETVIAAIKSGRLDTSAVSPAEIRKAIVWRAYNKLTYIFRSDYEIDYHGILQWAAEKSDIPARRINEYSTFRLEKEVAEEHFAKAWEMMTPEERSAVLPVSGAGVMGGAQAFGVMSLGAGDIVDALSVMKSIWDMIKADSNTISDFIMAVNLIKTRKYAK